MITISQVFVVYSTSTVIGISCALAVPRTWAAEAALGVGIVIVVAMFFIASRREEVTTRKRGEKRIVDGIPPGLSDLTRSESSHLDYYTSRNDDDSDQGAHSWQSGEHSLEGSRQENRTSALPLEEEYDLPIETIERQGSGGSKFDSSLDGREEDGSQSSTLFDLDDSINERTQREIRRLTTSKDPARVLTSAHQLFLHGESLCERTRH